MSLTPERLIIIGLSILLFVAILFILYLYLLKKKDGNCGVNVGSGDFVPKDKHLEILRKYNECRDKLEKLSTKDYDVLEKIEYQDKFEKACVEIGILKSRIDELTRDNNELNVLYHKESNSNGDNEKSEAEYTKGENSMPQKKKDGQITMYSSFPRSAGSTIYFSDLTDKLVDDSYFELRISSDKVNASFRPLDFMKIRNYDPAMAAILTEGVKPNVASSVVKVEMGEACLEGNDWIIKRLAKVRLA